MIFCNRPREIDFMNCHLFFPECEFQEISCGECEYYPGEDVEHPEEGL